MYDAVSHAESKPTKARHIVLMYLCSLTFILYLDRVCISQAASAIRADLRLEKTEMSYVFVAFSIAYGAFMVPVGRLGDKWGSRSVLIAMVLLWSLFTALTGLVGGLVSLIVIRFIFGAAEAGAMPNCARVVSRWYPPTGRGLPQGLINTTALVGGAIAPVITVYTMLAVEHWINPVVAAWGYHAVGWRWAFFIFGVLGGAWVVLFAWWYRDDPNTHPAVNDAERKLITAGGESKLPSLTQEPVPWGIVVRSPNVLWLSTILICAAFASYSYMTWFPSYVEEGLGRSKETAGWLTSFVMGGGAAGSMIGGWAVDRLLSRSGGNKRVRCWLGTTVMGCSALLVQGALLFDDAEMRAALMALAFFCSMFQIAAWWGVITDVSGKHVAVMFGLMNGLGTFGAMGAQLLFGMLSDSLAKRGYVGKAQWDPSFDVLSVVLLIGAIAWGLVRPERSVVEPRAVPS